MLWKVIIFACCLYAVSSQSNKLADPGSLDLEALEDREVHPDVGLRVPELVRRYNYPLESHQVITSDGYHLILHRIPHGRDNAKVANRPVVFLMHGLLCSSADWVLMGPEKGLAFLLADMGYDVWMGNARGNTYSRNHSKWSPDYNKKKFWTFSWHEIGTIDVRTSIDYILDNTGVEQIYYIAHSQGTTAFFVMTSTYPAYNDKVRLMIALAPVAYMENIPNVALRIISNFINVIDWIFSMLGGYEFMPSTAFMQMIGQALCNDHSIVQEMCSNVLFMIAGYDSEQLNRTTMPVILSNTPAGASTKQFVHYGQEVKSGKFRQYDHGLLNVIKYGSMYPPRYDLSKVSAPVALLYGENDALTSETDIERLRTEIQNPVIKYKVPHPKFNHLDFLWSTDIIPLLYDKVFDLLDRYS